MKMRAGCYRDEYSFVRTMKYSHSHSSMPPHFSWIEDGVLAASALVFHHSHVQYLRAQRIQSMIHIGDDLPSNVNDLPWTRFFVADHCQPTYEQIVDFVDLVFTARKRGEAVLVQSTRGRGALSIFLASYLAVRWACTAEMAIDGLLKMRPASFDTPSERSAVHEFVMSRLDSQCCERDFLKEN